MLNCSYCSLLINLLCDSYDCVSNVLAKIMFYLCLIWNQNSTLQSQCIIYLFILLLFFLSFFFALCIVATVAWGSLRVFRPYITCSKWLCESAAQTESGGIMSHQTTKAPDDTFTHAYMLWYILWHLLNIYLGREGERDGWSAGAGHVRMRWMCVALSRPS